MDASTTATALVLLAIGLQTFWISRALGRVETKVDTLVGQVGTLSTEVTKVGTTIDLHINDARAHTP